MLSSRNVVLIGSDFKFSKQYYQIVFQNKKLSHKITNLFCLIIRIGKNKISSKNKIKTAAIFFLKFAGQIKRSDFF